MSLSPLYLACARNAIDDVRAILAHGTESMNVHADNYNGDDIFLYATPLGAALWYGASIEIIRLLLEASADPTFVLRVRTAAVDFCGLSEEYVRCYVLNARHAEWKEGVLRALAAYTPANAEFS